MAYSFLKQIDFTTLYPLGMINPWYHEHQMDDLR